MHTRGIADTPSNSFVQNQTGKAKTLELLVATTRHASTDRTIEHQFQVALLKARILRSFETTEKQASPNTTDAERKAQELIAQNTHDGRLDTEALAADLAELAIVQPDVFDEVTKHVMESIADKDRDEVAQSFVHSLSGEEMRQIGATPDGSKALLRMFQELSSGKVTDDELKDLKKLGKGISLGLADLAVSNPAQARAAIEDLMSVVGADYRDEFAQEFVESFIKLHGENGLRQLAGTPEGLQILLRMEGELIAGRTTGDEYDTIEKIYQGIGQALADLAVADPEAASKAFEMIINRLDENGRDEVAQVMADTLSARQIHELGQSDEGHTLLESVKRELLTGNVTSDEEASAKRLLLNSFQMETIGPKVPLEAHGSWREQVKQAALTGAFTLYAIQSQKTNNDLIPGQRSPSDATVETILSGLNRNPPYGDVGNEITRSVYSSTIPNATPEQAYNYFVENPEEIFGAGGMEVRPATERLVDGGRYMLEVGAPPTWLPVEIELDPQTHTITIHTLDGHPLRGMQTFTFADNGQGGVTLTQDAKYQASSEPVERAPWVPFIPELIDEQHKAWESAHLKIYEHFNN
ncbi:MAG TPA: hypothetical protein VF666_10705 [Pyrinomonadaceae bacterium]|jgi:hypothetical protein